MEHFIETVRQYPCLWNTTAIEYRDQELKDAAWAEVMKETDLSSVKEVKLKWKKLRDSYRDALKRQGETPAAHSAAAPAKKPYPWKYMARMQFLQPHMSVRKKPADSPPRAAAAPPPSAPGAAPQPTRAPPAENGHAHERSSDESESEAESSPKRKSAERLTVIDRKLDYLCKAHAKRPCVAGDAPAYRREGGAGGAAPAPAPDPLDIFFNGMCQSTKRLPYPTQIKIKRTLFAAVIEAEEALVAEQQSYAALWAAGGASSTSSDAPDADTDEPRAS